MKTETRKLRSPLKWHGGKSYLCRRFIDLFPEHDLYIEPFAGGLSTLLNKPPVQYEVVSDLNGDLIQTWRTIRDLGRAVIDFLLSKPYCSDVFEEAKSMADSPFLVINAAGFIIRNRMSRGGLGKDFAWSDRLRGKRRPDGPVPGEINSWETFINNDLPRIIDRIQDVGFQNRHALEVIEYARDPCGVISRPLIYADPPYLHETRTHKAAYDHEMSRGDHEQLLVALRDSPAKVFLSGYHSPLYDEALREWTCHEFEMPNHSGQGKSKQRRVECLWESPDRW